MAARREGADLVVLQSFPEPRVTTNPYIVMLRECLEETPGVEVLTFSWRRAITGRYDVFHVHWPEILPSGRTLLRGLVRQILTALLLLRLTMTRRPLVRTLHNLRRPEGLSRREHLLLTWVERLTSMVVLINDSTTAPPGKATRTILHGHYRDWYARYPQPEARPGGLAFFGLIRRYKGVDGLIRAFSLTAQDLHLTVAGNPSAGLGESLTAMAAGDDRIDLVLKFLSDEELVEVARRAELVVLPYREMHNSGGALAALSLDRPVLVPANLANELLSAEVGMGWVLQYDGDLAPDDLVKALELTRDTSRTTRPDLSKRDWSHTGAAHRAAYRAAIDNVRGR